MAVLTKAAFLAKYDTIFADNTTGDISEQDMRDFRQDIADSFLNVIDEVGLKFDVLEIGDWNMDTTAIKTIDISAYDHTKIRFVTCIVRPDSDALVPDSHYQAPYFDSFTAVLTIGSISGASDTIPIQRAASSFFDSTDFDATSYNRGWVTIGYVS